MGNQQDKETFKTIHCEGFELLPANALPNKND